MNIIATYADHLVALGFRPKIDDDGDIVVKSEGYTFLITADAEDEGFVQIICPNVAVAADDLPAVVILQAANVVAGSVKCVKAVVSSHTAISFVVDARIHDADAAKFDLERYLDASVLAIAKATETIEAMLATTDADAA